jgi:hypothetical protein
MAVCHYHRDRPGVGVCMRCRVVICSECCTRLDGVNHCHACLKALGRRREVGVQGRLPHAVLAVCVLALAWLFFFGAGWLVRGIWAP